MGLYGIYGSHPTEKCPWNNAESRKVILEHGLKTVEEASKVNIKIINQYHSALEHTFLWVVEANDAHLVQSFFTTSYLSKINALKIVPLITYSDVIEHNTWHQKYPSNGENYSRAGFGDFHDSVLDHINISDLNLVI